MMQARANIPSTFLRYTFLCLAVCCPGIFRLQAQVKLRLVNTDKAEVFRQVNYKPVYPGYPEAQQQLQDIVRGLQHKGYLLAGIDSCKKDSLSCTAYLHIGSRYKWGQLRAGAAAREVLAETGYRERFYSNTPFSPAELSRLFEKTLNWCENNGYPFAAVKLDSVEVQKERITAVFQVSKNKRISIDSIIVQGNATVNKTFLRRYFQVKEGSPYNEQALRNISRRAQQLPFIRETKPQQVRISDKYTRLYLFFDRKNASQFDGIIGLLPDATGRTTFTGDVRIRLQNAVFRAGELIDINWRRLQTQTQDLNTRLVYPYLFNTPIGTDYSLKIYRRDTTFLDIQNNLGLQYIFSGLNNLKVFYRQRSTSLLSTAGLETLTVLPDYADVSTSSYGIGFNFEQLDYKFNPRKGLSVSASASVGNRRIKKNSKLNAVVYNNLKLSSTQYQADAELALYLPLFRRSAIKLGEKFGTIYGEQVFKNELYRIGGLKNLRGMNEESIFASTYAVSTIEYRFLFEQNSAIYLFADGAWYENNSINTYLTDTPYSVGAGISFETRAGIFSLNYALGRQFSNPFDIRSGKIHFGIVNSF